MAAVELTGDITFFSTPGASTTVSAFGGFDTFTTDRTGADGYEDGDFNSSFAGTSAAAPIVSGIVALMLEANSDLGWRDVQTILAYSARQVGSEVEADAMAMS